MPGRWVATPEVRLHLAEVGGYADLEPSVPGHGGPLPLEAALSDTGALRARVAASSLSLGSGEARVAASSLQYELAERLWLIALLGWTRHRAVLPAAALTVDTGHVHSWRLVLADDVRWPVQVNASRAAAEICAAVVGRLEILHRHLRSVTPIASPLLWGNASTALALAYGALPGGTAHSSTRGLVEDVLEHAHLRERFDGPLDGPITRRSCCLYYRSADPRPCPDCPISQSVAVARASTRAGTGTTARAKP